MGLQESQTEFSDWTATTIAIIWDRVKSKSNSRESACLFVCFVVALVRDFCLIRGRNRNWNKNWQQTHFSCDGPGYSGVIMTWLMTHLGRWAVLTDTVSFTPSAPWLPFFSPVCSKSCMLSWWCYPPISSSANPFSSCIQSFPASGSFPMNHLFPSGGQSIGVSASASVLSMNIQDWFPLGWTGWISLQSKGLSRVFSNPKVQKHQFFGAQPFLWWPTLTFVQDYWKNHSLDYMHLCWQNDISAF